MVNSTAITKMAYVAETFVALSRSPMIACKVSVFVFHLLRLYFYCLASSMFGKSPLSYWSYMTQRSLEPEVMRVTSYLHFTPPSCPQSAWVLLNTEWLLQYYGYPSHFPGGGINSAVYFIYQNTPGNLSEAGFLSQITLLLDFHLHTNSCLRI